MAKATTPPKPDIEDLLGRQLLRYLVNRCLGVDDKHGLPETRPIGASERLAKEADDLTKIRPPGVPEFNHYKAADGLLGLTDEEISGLPGLDDALDNFEKLFHDINGLIRQP